MATQVDPAVLQRTRETLGKVIKKPPLTDKLLSRPPFRFLHDIVSEVNKNTGFFDGLYAANEMDAKSIQDVNEAVNEIPLAHRKLPTVPRRSLPSSNVWPTRLSNSALYRHDKDAKVAFLQKAIDTLSFTTGEMVKVKPSKVVAGQDAEKTNEFLQILSISILKDLDSSEAIQRVLGGEKPSETLAKERKKRPNGDKPGKENDAESASKRRSRSKERPGEERKRSGGDGGAARTKPRDSRRDAPEGQMSLRSKSHQNLKDKQQSKSSDRPTHRPSSKRPPPENEPSSKGNKQGDPPEESHSVARNLDTIEDEGLGSETRLDRPSSAKGARRRETHSEAAPQINGTSVEPSPPPDHPSVGGATVEESHDQPSGTANQSLSSPPPVQNTLAPPMRRPGSARPAPPKVVKSSSNKDPPSGTIQSESVPPPSVIMDQDELDDEDDNQYVVEDSTPLAPPPEEAFPSKDNETINKPEGALTKNIMAMKERLEGDLPQEEQSGLPIITEAQRRKEREMVTKEIEKLQASIQTLCRSANPLGKIMDYVQEDIDSMQKELEMWKAENERHAEAIRKEESITEQELSPLKAQLDELEARINEQVDLISATKANILRNEEKTHQILNSMSFAST